MSNETINLGECVVSIHGYLGPGQYTRQNLGTGFRLARSNLVVTAKHVVGQFVKCAVVSNRPSDSMSTVTPSEETLFPPDAGADLAVLVLEETGDWQRFALQPPSDSSVLGMRVASYGFPAHKTNERTPRIMFGHIQRIYIHADDKHQDRYSAYELGFPSFKGQSGSPVFSDELTPKARQNVLAVVTNSIVYRQSAEPTTASASWAVGLALAPFADWLNSI